ncbi:MAG: hypothetical protein MRJ67_14825 [Nitrospirales bacterium]|nr:hypothetical protein [Nitrospirales bacterium]
MKQRGFEFFDHTGLRWDQVDFNANCIRLASSQTKTKTPRIIYMCEDFLRVMQRAKEVHNQRYPDRPYVCHLKGKPFLPCGRAGMLLVSGSALPAKSFMVCEERQLEIWFVWVCQKRWRYGSAGIKCEACLIATM